MAQDYELEVNGTAHQLTAEPDTPLLYVLSDDLALRGPRFGCGLAQCGACSVLVSGREVRSCVYPLGAVAGRDIITLEGLADWHARRKGAASGDAPLHPVQAALLELQAPQCGFCYGGIIIKAAELLEADPDPDDAAIDRAMAGHMCRCGTYPRIRAAIKQAAAAMREA